MRLILAAVAALTVLSLPAHAQDIAAEYANAYRAFSVMPDGGVGVEAAAAAVVALLPTLEGEWVEAGILAGDTPFVDVDLIVRACERVRYNLVQTSQHGFTLNRLAGQTGESMAVRHDYRAMNIFQRSVAENDFLNLLGIDPLSDQAARALSVSDSYGRVYLFHPSANILVMQLENGTTEIYARCP